MRKRNCDRIFDNILWYTIYLLPIILTLIAMFGLTRSTSIPEWSEYDGGIAITDMGFWGLLQGACRSLGVSSNSYFNVVFTYFCDIELGYGATLLSPGAGPGLCYYLCYFCSVYLLHLVVDFLLFIPRLCHKWMNAFTREGD